MGDTVSLEREADNPHDKNAIKVLTPDGGMLGYVSAGDGQNIIMANLMDAGEPLFAEVSQKTRALTYINVFTSDDDPMKENTESTVAEESYELIKLIQIPVIEEKLKNLSARIEVKLSSAMNLVCNEETVKAVKEVRAELNKEFDGFEAQRKAIKTAIMEPYEEFEEVYKEYVSSKYKQADRLLAEKINSTESELKGRKTEEVRRYFNELKVSLNIEGVNFEDMNLKVNLSDSLKKLREKTEKYLTKFAEDLKMIYSLDESIRADVLSEFRTNGFNAANAAITVTERNRKRREEEENIRRAEEARKAEEERIARAREAAGVTLRAPEVKKPTEAPQEKVFSLKFRVTGTKAQLIELKTFLETGGYTYESIK